MTVVGRTYLEHGKPVVVLVQWRGARLHPVESTGDRIVGFAGGLVPRWKGRNVLIRRRGGELVVRPFRGLRKP